MANDFWDINVKELDAEDYLGIKRHAFRNEKLGYWLSYIGIPLWEIKVWYPLYRQMKIHGYMIGELGEASFSGFFHPKLPFGYYWIGFDYAHNYNCLPFSDQKELTEGEYMDVGDILLLCDEMIEEIRGVSEDEDNFSKITEEAIENASKKRDSREELRETSLEFAAKLKKMRSGNKKDGNETSPFLAIRQKKF